MSDLKKKKFYKLQIWLLWVCYQQGPTLEGSDVYKRQAIVVWHSDNSVWNPVSCNIMINDLPIYLKTTNEVRVALCVDNLVIWIPLPNTIKKSSNKMNESGAPLRMDEISEPDGNKPHKKNPLPNIFFAPI